MIQGGDPNTIDGDPNTWGIGGPLVKVRERVDAEFNTIKHNRGIVSMARSADPNSGWFPILSLFIKIQTFLIKNILYLEEL